MVRIKKKSDFTNALSNFLLLFAVIMIFVSFFFVVSERGADISGFTVKTITNAVQFETQGVLTNLKYEDRGIVLETGKDAGSYVSEIFDGEEGVVWNNISWESSVKSSSSGVEDYILYYSFEDGTSDISGNGNDGALKGQAALTLDGKEGKGVKLDGYRDYVSFSDPLGQSPSEQEWTVIKI